MAFATTDDPTSLNNRRRASILVDPDLGETYIQCRSAEDPTSPNPRRTMPTNAINDTSPHAEYPRIASLPARHPGEPVRRMPRDLPVENPYRAPLDTDDLAQSIARLLKREVYEPVLPCRITSIADSLWLISDAEGRILRMSTKPLLPSDLLIDDATEFGATVTFGSPPPTLADILREEADKAAPAPLADTAPTT